MKEIYLYIIQRIHPGSILVAIVFDLFWSLFEGGATATGIGIVLEPFLVVSIFVACLGAVTLIQRFGSHDEWSTALAKGVGFGLLAAAPFSVSGLVGGVGLGLMRQRYGADEEVILLGTLTRSWREVENMLRKMVPPQIRGNSLDDVINYLYNQRLLSNDLANQLHTLRKQRNTNMHEFTTDQLSSLVQDVLAMENTLHTRFSNIA